MDIVASFVDIIMQLLFALLRARLGCPRNQCANKDALRIDKVISVSVVIEDLYLMYLSSSHALLLIISRLCWQLGRRV